MLVWHVLWCKRLLGKPEPAVHHLQPASQRGGTRWLDRDTRCSRQPRCANRVPAGLISWQSFQQLFQWLLPLVMLEAGKNTQAELLPLLRELPWDFASPHFSCTTSRSVSLVASFSEWVMLRVREKCCGWCVGTFPRFLFQHTFVMICCHFNTAYLLLTLINFCF